MNKALLAIVVVVVLVLGGWFIYDKGKSNNNSSSTNSSYSSNSNKSSSSSSNQSTGTGAITIKNMMFTPSQITVPKGGTVTWTNNDSTAHTVVEDNGTGPNSGDIQPGATYSYTYKDAGSYQYHCSIHPSMRGTIVVK